MKKILFLSLIAISVMILAGCEGKRETSGCPGDKCVYMNTDKDIYYYGADVSIVKDATSDYTNVKNNGRTRTRTAFMGFILDKDDKIERAFVCGLKDNDVFCIEGSHDGSKYESNKKIMEKVFGKENCYSDATSYRCSTPDHKIGATTQNEGYVVVNDDYDHCYMWIGGSSYRMSCQY